MTAKDLADVTISIDCDGQDDINAMDAMIDEYLARHGRGVRRALQARDGTPGSNEPPPRAYKVMKALGADVVFNHADYRLLSKRALEAWPSSGSEPVPARPCAAGGYRCSSVYYERAERIAVKAITR